MCLKWSELQIKTRTNQYGNKVKKGHTPLTDINFWFKHKLRNYLINFSENKNLYLHFASQVNGINSNYLIYFSENQTLYLHFASQVNVSGFKNIKWCLYWKISQKHWRVYKKKTLNHKCVSLNSNYTWYCLT